jgi:hypothetical protein
MKRQSAKWLLIGCLALAFSTVGLAQQQASSPGRSLGDRDVTIISIKGRSLTSEEADALEQTLAKDPNDLTARFTLISYYSAHFETPMKAKKCEHVLWTIESIPDSTLLRHLSQVRLNKPDSCFDKGSALWVKQLEANQGNLAVLRNAIDFFMVPDKPRAEKLIMEGAVVEPKNSEWPRQLGRLYSLQMSTANGDSRRQFAKKAYDQFEQAFTLTADDRGKRQLRIELARTAFEAGETSRAVSLASELLGELGRETSPGFRADLSHNVHTILGRAALRNGDVAEGKLQLIAAGQVDGSPVLSSFGPSMLLAKELLDKGERETVLEYFAEVGAFWKNVKLQQWIATVKSGGIPDFGGNSMQ